jgi:lipopolysaccharide biosynthesis glycosyltransferase
MKNMDIVFGVNDNYAKHCGATITSGLCNRKVDADNDKIKFFLIVDLSDENKRILLH